MARVFRGTTTLNPAERGCKMLGKSRLVLAFVTAFTMLVGGFTTPPAEAAMTACFKYQMKVRTTRSIDARVVRTLSLTKVSGPVTGGWIKVKGGWVKLGPPNQIPCGSSSKTANVFSGITSGVNAIVKGIAASIKRFNKDVVMAHTAQSRLPALKFCEKHRSDFGWTKCYAESVKLGIQASRLTSTNTDATARVNARGYVANFLRNDIVAQTQTRLGQVVESDLSGVPSGRWNSTRIKNLESLAKRLASSSTVKSWDKFLSRTHPKLRDGASLLKTQHPALVDTVAPFQQMLAGSNLSPVERKAVAKGVDPLLLEDQAVFADLPPIDGLKKWVTSTEKTLPLPKAQFDSIEADAVSKAHNAVYDVLKDESEITLQTYAKARKLETYKEDANVLLRQQGQENVVHPCDLRKAKEKAVCKDAVSKILQVEVVRSAYAAAFQTFKVLPQSTTAEELGTYVGQVRVSYKDKIHELTTPKVTLYQQAINFVAEYQNMIALAILGLVTLGLLIKRRPSTRSKAKHGLGRL